MPWNEVISMTIQVPENTSVLERMRLFNEYLDERFARVDTVSRDAENFDDRTRLKSERAEVNVIRSDFQHLFENELSYDDS
jgi:hypothetical protein